MSAPPAAGVPRRGRDGSGNRGRPPTAAPPWETLSTPARRALRCPRPPRVNPSSPRRAARTVTLVRAALVLAALGAAADLAWRERAAAVPPLWIVDVSDSMPAEPAMPAGVDWIAAADGAK